MFSADLGVNQVASTPSSNDPPFQKVALLLHSDGTNGAQNNTFVDSSTNNFTITRTGNVAQGTFSPFSLAEGQWSNYFDGNGDYLTSSAPNLSGTWTVECWVYRTAGSVRQALGFFNNGSFSGVVIVINASNYIEVDDGNTAQAAFTGASVPINSWTHIAIVRNGTTTTGYVNGVSAGSNSFTPATTNSVSIGRYVSANPLIYTGYISNFRLVNGTAVYTSAFTPPTSALTAISGTSLLTCQSNRFKDNSSNNFTITSAGDTKVTAFSPFAPSAAYSASTNGGSGYFDGSGDTLETPSIGVSNSVFCYECWLYPTVTQGAFTGIFVANTNNGLQLSYYDASGSGGLGIAQKGVSWQLFNNDGKKPIVGQWNHVAFVRSGTGTNQTSIFLNGVRVANGTVSYTYTASNYQISTTNAGGTVFQGYMSGSRLTLGSTPYDATQSTITIPTAPLTAVTNTQLLLNCTNAGIIDNAGKNDIETVGNAQVSTSVKKYGTGSMYFDGTGDWLNSQPSDVLNFGTGDFTIEGWYYPTSYTVSNNVLIRLGTTAADKIVIATIGTSGHLYYLLNGSVVISSTSSGGLNTWSHFALSKSGSTTTLYLNGISLGTTTSVPTSSNKYIQVGTDASGATFYGYIDDLRITKGVAVYTSNFTPPTQAFPDV